MVARRKKRIAGGLSYGVVFAIVSLVLALVAFCKTDSALSQTAEAAGSINGMPTVEQLTVVATNQQLPEQFQRRYLQ